MTDEQPVPDGRLIITLRHSGEELTFDCDANRGWRFSPTGIMLQYGDHDVVIPWPNVAMYDVHPNSHDFDARMIEWLRECDHAWLTHPVAGTYCSRCRLDFDDLVELMSPSTITPPGLIIRDERMDAVARRHDVGAVDEGVERAGTVITETVGDVCECATPDDGEHAGPCKFKPETWSS